MAEENRTIVTEFILLGFTDNRELKVMIFVVILFIYLVSLMGNLGMATLIWIDTRLHTPMYFFLSNLALLDVGYSSIIAPQTLMFLVVESKVITFTGCAGQFYFICIAVSCECCLLGVMAYDRFIAIRNPLHYTVIMSTRFCVLLVLASYLVGLVNATFQTVFIFRLSFCRSNVINHFFCDGPPLLKLSCSDSHIADIVHFIFSTAIALSTVLTIIISYMCIVITILRISSTEGRCKAFSTCASHLMAVSIFYGTAIFMYLRPSSKYSIEQDKIISVFYSLVIPMLNPLIYSLRNKEVKEAFRRIKDRKVLSLSM